MSSVSERENTGAHHPPPLMYSTHLFLSALVSDSRSTIAGGLPSRHTAPVSTELSLGRMMSCLLDELFLVGGRLG